MQIYLPPPYPDELLYSVIARYMTHTGVISTNAVMVQIFGKRFKKPGVDVQGSLKVLSQAAWLSWRVTSDEIANKLTLLPIYSRYLPKERSEQCRKSLMEKNICGTVGKLGLIGKRANVAKKLRFCRSCRDIDILAFGETYWRRRHQLPGILVCPDHGEWLLDSNVFVRTITQYEDATSATAECSAATSPYVNVLGQEELVKYLKVAKRCADMIDNHIALWPTLSNPQVYRQAALQRGFLEGYSVLTQSPLEEAFKSFYGENLLSFIGCNHSLGKKSSWLRRIFQSRQQAHYPLEHALVQIFLESTQIDTSKRKYGFGPWKCPNPYILHKDPYPIKDIEIRRRSSDKIVAYAKCSCGYSFSFSTTNEDDPQLPVVQRVGNFGPSWQKKVEHLRKQGLSIRNIGKQLGVCDMTIKRLLGKKQYRVEPTPEEIHQRRKEWKEILSTVQNLKQAFVNKKNKKLYIWLSRHDPNWPYKTPRNGFYQPPRPGPVDWKERDKQWSALLRLSANRLKIAVPAKQATKTGIIRGAELCYSVLHEYAKFLPLSLEVLAEENESISEFRGRRLYVAAEK